MGDENEARLMRHLMANYDPAVRPAENSSLPLTVIFGVSLHHIIDVVSMLLFEQFHEYCYNYVYCVYTCRISTSCVYLCVYLSTRGFDKFVEQISLKRVWVNLIYAVIKSDKINFVWKSTEHTLKDNIYKIRLFSVTNYVFWDVIQKINLFY